MWSWQILHGIFTWNCPGSYRQKDVSLLITKSYLLKETAAFFFKKGPVFVFLGVVLWKYTFWWFVSVIPDTPNQHGRKELLHTYLMADVHKPQWGFVRCQLRPYGTLTDEEVKNLNIGDIHEHGRGAPGLF